jgi:S1-C subfamily serine protease
VVAGLPNDTVQLRNWAEATDSAGVKLPQNFSLLAHITHRIPEFDLAVLRADTGQMGIYRYGFVSFSESDDLNAGDEVALCAFIPNDAFVRPRAFVAKGIVSTVRKQVYHKPCGRHVDFIQMDLTAAHGTSGGPVINTGTGLVVAMQDMGIFGSEERTLTPYPIGICTYQMLAKLDSLGVRYDSR